MFNHISWTDYFTAIFGLCIIYYLWVAFRFYRGTPLTLWTKSKAGDPSVPIPTDADIMGAVVPDAEQLRDESDIQFGNPEPDEPEIYYDGLTQDALKTEVMALIDVVGESKEPKENLLMLFGLLAEKYATIADEPTQAQINQLLLDHAHKFAFDLDKSELYEIWNKPVNI